MLGNICAIVIYKGDRAKH